MLYTEFEDSSAHDNYGGANGLQRLRDIKALLTHKFYNNYYYSNIIQIIYVLE